jgi:heme-degrading monooxygenase HmoA
MYARVITSQLQPGKTDEAVRVWHESATPLLKQRPGFKGTYLLGDRNTGRGVTITLWESEADAIAMDTSGAYQQAIGLFAKFFVAPPAREQFEVLLQV